jgi:hypothetical protein
VRRADDDETAAVDVEHVYDGGIVTRGNRRTDRFVVFALNEGFSRGRVSSQSGGG